MPFYKTYMGKRTLLQRLKSATAAELIAGSFVAVIFVACLITLYLGIEWVRQEAPRRSIWHGAMSNMTLSILAMIVSWFCAISIGNRLASKMLPRTLDSAISVAAVMRDFGLYSIREFFDFAHRHDLAIYRAQKALVNEAQENMRCRFESLFTKFLFYSPWARESHYAKNLLCLEQGQVEAALARTVEPLARFRPVAVRAVVVEEAERVILALREEIKELQNKLNDKNLEEGPSSKASKHKLFLIAQLFVAFFIRDQLMEDENEGKPHTIEDIDNIYKTFVSRHSGLKKLLNELKPDTKHDSFNKQISKLVRISMEPGKVSWGGDAKTSLRSVLLKIMTEKEAADFEEAYSSAPDDT